MCIYMYIYMPIMMGPLNRGPLKIPRIPSDRSRPQHVNISSDSGIETLESKCCKLKLKL